MSAITLESKLTEVMEPSLKGLTNVQYSQPAEEQCKTLQDLTKPHVDSFNWFINEGMKLLPEAVKPVEMEVFGRRLSIKVSKAFVEKPKVEDSYHHCRTLKVYPSECRQRSSTYQGRLIAHFDVLVDGMKHGEFPYCLGSIPIMVKSVACNLHGLTPKELIKRQEEEEEMGGYFIVNGNEKVIRMLIMQRRNYPIGIVRDSWKKRGPNFTEFAVSMRSMTEYQTTANVLVHYLSNGTFVVCIFHNKQMFFLPLILVLKALVNFRDFEIYKELICTKDDDTYFKGCICNMLRQSSSQNVHDQNTILKFLGEKFRHKFLLPEWVTDKDIGKHLLDNCLLIHLESNEDKFRCLCLMTRKVFDMAMGKCMPDNADSLQNQEVLLPGHLMKMFLIEKLGIWFQNLKRIILKKCNASTANMNMVSMSFLQGCMNSLSELTQMFNYLLATGNLSSISGLGLQQSTGLCIVADKLNFLRYISHFRCVHRGAVFAAMRTTTVRKLLPESWGFLCPVHTPDGAPCGLLNHLTYLCEVVTHSSSTSVIEPILLDFGMVLPSDKDVCGEGTFYPVLLNGKLLGWLPVSLARKVVKFLRWEKATGGSKIPSTLEICLMEYTGTGTQYPGLYLITDPARLIRPVVNLYTETVELVGSFEQVYMDICSEPEDAHDQTTHQEITRHLILSSVASLTPFSDHNQSPRNMYQCQMGKQTMGTPCHTFPYRADNKLYRIQSPQSALVRPHLYDHYKIDNYPLGTNAIVAVISYSGYDMEDAVVINKSSLERGFLYGSIYKSTTIDLAVKLGDRTTNITFGVNPNDPRMSKLALDSDGLPSIGTRLTNGCDYYSYVDHSTGEMTVEKYREDEVAYVDNVRVLSNNAGTGYFKRVSITVRIPRKPIIGDKFASRHGQKGICSQLWPAESMPFTESGMVPDILFNPHSFPSRMTIGMLIEIMAGKSAAVHGHCYDATPFAFNEKKLAIEYFADRLQKSGFNYYGEETMFSGVSGCELKATIFIGVCYYQRLRHMVLDKFQVRTTGPVDQITMQPIKGRNRGGGIRFGEMERDALLAHGCAYTLRDRLLICSDYSQAYVCEKCGSLLSPQVEYNPDLYTCRDAPQRWFCKVCETGKHLSIIDIPFVFRYLVNELAAMNIKLVLKLKDL